LKIDAEAKLRESDEIEKFIEDKMQFSTPFVKACLVYKQDQSERLGTITTVLTNALTVWKY
jgi:hypothetical protein